MTSDLLTFGQIGILLLGDILCGELLIVFPLLKQAHQLTDLIRHILKILPSPRISDHWKERVVMAYARRLLVYSLSVPLMLLLAIAPIGASLYLLTENAAQMLTLSMSPEIIISTSLLVPIYLWIRTR